MTPTPLADPASLAALGAGCALGGVARSVLTDVLTRRFGDALPWGTLAVNLSGAFGAGWLSGLIHDGGIASWLGAALLMGFLGSYTTVSALGLNTLQLLHAGRPRAAIANLAGTLLIGLVAAAAGFAVGTGADVG